MEINQSHCNLCDRKFEDHSFRYYCCNSSIHTCFLCNDKICEKCKTKRGKRYSPQKCFQCRLYVSEANAFFEYNRQNYFCVKCLRKAYQKIMGTNQKTIYLNQASLFKSEFDRSEVELFLRNFCWKCMKKFSFEEEKQFQNELNLEKIACIKCPERPSSKKQKMTQNQPYHSSSAFSSSFSNSRRCNSCDFLIFDNKGFITEDFAICESCARFSSYEQEKLTTNIPMYFQKKQQIDDEWDRKDEIYWSKLENKEEMVERKQSKEVPQTSLNQPTITEDKNYRKQINQSQKENYEEEFKRQEQIQKMEQINLNQIKQSFCHTDETTLKKSDSSKLLEKQKLVVEKKSKGILKCAQCFYEVDITDIIDNICRCCYVENREKKQQLQKEKKLSSGSKQSFEKQFFSKNKEQLKSHTSSNYKETEKESFRQSNMRSSNFEERGSFYQIEGFCDFCLKKKAYQRINGKKFCISCKIDRSYKDKNKDEFYW